MSNKDEAGDAAVPVSGTPDFPKRSEQRVVASVELRVLGIDANGMPFYTWATTQDISLSGARIAGLSVKLNAGEMVGVQCGKIKTRFKVAWVQPNADGTFQAGLQCMEKGAAPWREGAHEPERPSRGLYSCLGTASLHSTSDGNSTPATVRELSLAGCYVQCEQTAATGEILRGRFFFSGMHFDAVAQVRTSVPGSGMELQWTDLGSNGQEKLSHILSSLAASSSLEEPSANDAKARIDELHAALTQFREQLESGRLPAGEAMRLLDNVHGSVTAALQLVQR
jgi:PilZ domain-containing protein